jgi:signal transduction histidine kinase
LRASIARVSPPKSLLAQATLLASVPIAFLLLFLTLVTIFARTIEQSESSLHTYTQVFEQTDKVKQLLLEASQGLEHYALSRRKEYLAPYARATTQLPHELATLKQLAAGDARLSAAVVPYANDINNGLTILAAFRTALSSGGMNEAKRVAATPASKRFSAVFNSDRLALNTLTTEDLLAQLAKTQQDVSTNERILLICALAGFVATGLIVAAFGLRFVRRVGLLAQNTRLLSLGSAPVPLAGNDEIANLDRVYRETFENVAGANRELEAANAELESFSYSVSHDLRAPLRAIAGYSRMLEDDYAETLDAEARRRLDAVQSEAGRMGALIDDLLEYSRLGRASLASVVVDMDRLVREIVASHVDRIGSDRLLVEIGSLSAARGDRTALRQVWENLIGNAVKYSGKEPRQVVTISAEPNGSCTVYSIRDNGVGFDMKYAAKLFGVFERLHAPDEFEGTGVGLAIVRRVIARHGGQVWADATPGEGARFSFTLPN